MEIEAKDTIVEALQKNPAAAEILQGLGMHCIGCAMARGETIEEAAMVHNIPLDLMLEKLNENIG